MRVGWCGGCTRLVRRASADTIERTVSNHRHNRSTLGLRVRRYLRRQFHLKLPELGFDQHALGVEHGLLCLKALQQSLCVVAGRWDPVRTEATLGGECRCRAMDAAQGEGRAMEPCE